MRKRKNGLFLGGLLMLVLGIIYEFPTLSVFGVALAAVGLRGEEVKESKNTLLEKWQAEVAKKLQPEAEGEEKKPVEDEPLFNFEDNG